MSRLTHTCLGSVAAAMTTLGAMAAPQPAYAQDGPNTGKVSLSLGADIASQYYFRGILQEDSGLIFQPYVDVGFNVFEGEGTISSVDIYGGGWSSVHSESTLPSSFGGTTGNIFETDYYFGVAATFFEKFTADLSWIAFTFPDNTGGTIQEIDLKVGFDDSEYLGKWALNPYFLLAFEVEGSHNTYGEVGVEPSFTVYESEDYPVTLSVPVSLGFSIDDYYTDATGDEEEFGYASVGVSLSTPLPFIPDDFGSWELSGGLSVLFLNDNIPGFDDNGEDLQPVGTIGVSMTY